MSDFRERLNRLRVGTASAPGDPRGDMISELRSRIDRIMKNKTSGPRPEPSVYSGPGIEELVTGGFHAGQSGRFFVAREEYETGYLHGNIRLEDVFHQSLEIFGEIGNDSALASMIPDQTVFVDTETTGLSGGTGTYAFMVGIGYFEEQRFVVEQFLMRDQTEEADMLSLLARRLARFRCMVSFNGKSFDLPLLESRFILSRLEPLVLALPHLDLLHPARRIWKRSLESCRLGNLERELLGIERSDDVPGELIPGIYFHYLKTKDPTRMERVFYHNRLDILTLVTLTVLIQRRITDHTSAGRKDGLEQYSLGRIHFSQDRLDEAAACLVSALKESTYSDQEHEILKLLSLVYKKSGDLAHAVRAWKEMIEIDPDRSLFPWIELAKYYEHRERDFQRAEEYAQRALFLNEVLRAVDAREVERRVHRLRRKRERFF